MKYLISLFLLFPLALSGQWQQNGNDIYYDGGNVGIGTSTPTYPLTISNSNAHLFLIEDDYLNSGIIFEVNNGAFNALFLKKINNNSQYPFTFKLPTADYGKAIAISSTGNVGIGALPNISAKFHVYGNVRADEYQDQAGWSITPFTRLNNKGEWYTYSKVVFGSSAPIDTPYTVQVRGEFATNTLMVTGGSDFAERFFCNTLISEGSVVVLDRTKDNAIRYSTKPYDTDVIGVVSGGKKLKPGIILDSPELYKNIKFDESSKFPLRVAIAGKVWVKVCDENGRVKRGDMLTTSSEKGLAMRVIDSAFGRAKARGSIIGRAISEQGEDNFVLMLIE